MSISVNEANNTRKGRLAILLALSFCALTEVNAQQEWQFSQYQFNLFDYNSAYAGAFEEMSLGLRYRQMWAGFDGAPQSAHISLHTPFDGNFSGGLKVLSEQIGGHNRTSIRASGAYGLKLHKGRLAFALSGGIVQQNFRLDELILRQSSDPRLEQFRSSSSPVFDFAVLYTQEQFFIGAQVENLNKGTNDALRKHINATAGYVIKVGDNHAIRPSVLMRVSEGAPMQAEAHAAFFWQNRIWLGAGYRYDYGLIFTTEWKITPSLRLGYSLDLASNDLQTYQSGTHELFLGYNFQLGSQKAPSIRYF